jgi:hypothetical protein
LVQEYQVDQVVEVELTIIQVSLEEQQLNLHNLEILEHLDLVMQVAQEELLLLLDQVEEVVEQVQLELKVQDQVVLEELEEQEKIHHQ